MIEDKQSKVKIKLTKKAKEKIYKEAYKSILKIDKIYNKVNLMQKMKAYPSIIEIGLKESEGSDG